MKKINILHIRDSPWVDGPGRTILETATSIDSEKYGYYIGAFARKDSPANAFLQTAVDRKLNAFPIDESYSLDPTILYRIKKLIKAHRVDILHTHEVRSDIVGLIVGKITRIPVITTLHGWIHNDTRGKVYVKIDKSILPFFDHVIAVSEKMKEEVLRTGVCENRVSVLHNALVLNKYKRNTNDSAFRQQIGVSDDTYLVGNIGRLSPEKGHVDYLTAAAEVLKKFRNVKFAIIGSGSEERYLRNVVEEINISDSVIFAGYRNDMLTVYNSLDLVVQSSYTEGMPNVILEALAMEVPVIATDVGGTSEAVINNETGVLIQPGFPRELARNIGEYIEHPKSAEERVKNGKKLVETMFDFTVRTKKLSAIYSAIIKGRAH